jgi:hypothetical protein
VRFATITLCVASQRVCFVVSIYFVIDSVRKLLDTLVLFRESLVSKHLHSSDSLSLQMLSVDLFTLADDRNEGI